MRAVVLLVLLLAACTETTRVVATPTPVPTLAPTPPATTPARTSTPAPPTTVPATTPLPLVSPRPASPTAAASPSPARTASAALPTPPPEPALPAGATVVVKGERVFTLAALEQRVLDPAELARDAGRTAPACGSLVWTATWSAGAPVRAAFIHQTGRTELGLGRWGTASLGCSTLELRNESPGGIDVRIIFTIASQ